MYAVRILSPGRPPATAPGKETGTPVGSKAVFGVVANSIQMP
jgi:hypothetical protein